MPLSSAIKHAALLIALALGVRVGIVGAALGLSQKSLAQYSSLHDGGEYQQIAWALTMWDKELRDLPEGRRRLFPGYPAAVRLMVWSLGTPMAVSALATSILAGMAAVLLLYRLTREVWLAAWFAVFTPSWLLYSSLAMSEGLFVALALGGFILWRRRRDGLSALVFGLLTLIRPVGALVFLACWLVRLRGRQWRPCAIMASLYAIAPLSWMAAAWAVWGDPLAQVSSYVSRDWALPFAALIGDTFSAGIPLDKKALVWFTILTNAAAVVALTRRFLRRRDDESLGLLLWAGLIAFFFLALPSRYAFGSLDRFFIASLPPMMIGLAPFFPRKWHALAAIGAISTGICLYWNYNMFLAAIG
jgi:MYXO-CTERM domain-containing protein